MPLDTVLVSSVRFSRLPAYSFGLPLQLFAQECGSDCGANCQNIGMGLGSCCAECPQNLYGALWVMGSKPRKRSEEGAIADAGNCTGSVVEHAFFGNQYFRINEDVPQEVTDTLIAAAATAQPALICRSSCMNMRSYRAADSLDVLWQLERFVHLPKQYLVLAAEQSSGGEGTGLSYRGRRLADLNGRLQGILDHLTTVPTSAPSCSGTESIPLSSANEFAAPATSQSTGIASGSSFRQAITRPGGALRDDENSEYAPSYHSGWIAKLGLHRSLLDHLLDRYRSMQHHFPFVVIPVDWSAASMIQQQRPFLLLAATTTAASHYPRLQETLAVEVRDTLAAEVVVAGETSLDLLNGLLVYLACQQAYRFMQLAISILVDMGLNENPRTILEKRSDADPKDSGVDVGDDSESREASRTSLGCFYLSSVYVKG
ncbi:hypothetical protein LTR53_002283 [Teratosphaeriaceae sp. CCFEE 6253]|nr:hypothetical protein LTR53_002283 [Teratosphaeriaceae sp. CCFEE 6253]